MNKYLKYILLVLFSGAIALGLYHWQYNSPAEPIIPRQNSNRASLEDYYNDPVSPVVEPTEIIDLQAPRTEPTGAN